jgi:apolipoprotein N-acyltransferase
VLAAGFVLAVALAFPFRAGDFSFDLGPVAGWLAPVFLVGMTRGLRPRPAFLWSCAAATVGYSFVLYWIYVVVSVHGHAAAPIAVLAVLVLAFYVALHIGVAVAFAAWASPAAGPAAILLLPAAWVVTEHMRNFDLFSGFPWALLGYSLYALPPARALASVGGVYGLTFLLVLVGVLVWAPRRPRLRGLAIVAAAAFLGAIGPGGWGRDPTATGSTLRVGIVQASIPQEAKWDPDRAGEAFGAHLDLTRELLSGEGVDLVVWPEASVPVFLQYEPTYRDAVSDLAREGEVFLLTGGVAVERQGRGRDVRFHNSVFALDPQGRFVDRYDKSRLVPFGEYVPFRALLGFLSGLATGIASGDITPGERPRALRLEGLEPDHALAPLICYEVIYPGLVREAVRAGTDVLVNVTNDAWYGRTSAPHQFLNIAAMRAAEHGLPMVRAANTGVSAIVDARGSIRAATPIFEKHVLRSSLPRGRLGGTPYTRFGDWVVWTCWGILAYAGGRRVVGRGQRRDPRDGGSAPRPPGEGRRASEASLTSTPSSAE